MRIPIQIVLKWTLDHGETVQSALVDWAETQNKIKIDHKSVLIDAHDDQIVIKFNPMRVG